MAWARAPVRRIRRRPGRRRRVPARAPARERRVCAGGVGGFPFGGFGGFGGAGNGGGRGHGGSGSGYGGDGGHGGPTVDFEFLANDFHLPSEEMAGAHLIVLALLVIAGAYWVVPSGHQHSLHGLLGLRLHRYPAAAVPAVLDAGRKQLQERAPRKVDAERGQGEGVQAGILYLPVPVAVVARVAIGAVASHGDLPGQRRRSTPTCCRRRR